MAEEASENQFRSEVIRLLTTAVTKVDGLEGGVGGLDAKVEGLDAKLSRLEVKVDENTREIKTLQGDVRLLAGQFQDVAGVVYQGHSASNRLGKSCRYFGTGNSLG
jgi:hypothetical protein